MAEKIKAAIVGATGYGGGGLVRILLRHPHAELSAVVSSSSVGASLTESFPHLAGLAELELGAIDPELIRKKADVVFTATPHGVSSTLVPQLLDAGLKVIDLSGDLRLKDGEDYKKWYGKEPAANEYLEEAVYGLAEVSGKEVEGKRLISNPGCYPTATLLGLIPALAAGWIDPDSIIIDAKSGVSGAGRGFSLSSHYAEINDNMKPYKLGKHQHTPEIEQALSLCAGRDVAVTFTTHLAPMTRGILSTMYAKLTDDRTVEEFIAQYRSYYEGRPFVRIRPAGQWPASKEVAGSNYCDIGFSVDERTHRVTIVSVIDNLVKGAAGQAVQNLNLMMGWEETAGLEFSPLYP
ncbi:N-acetyl-gamma-glutamyl-phosphate reductase [Gorillibacterium timonense]|uniref:N-acetyl-gamma-glutamyl-phosphate reductase n=1 Tax=Gorillibacterium timonense TaxID=1689269 RepID=UPI00071D2942|nr:N-acetyl-gamma-glutamyl-phosphate reductase [Gorillibacterium timonense]